MKIAYLLHYIIQSCVVSLVVHHIFPHYLITGTNFGGKKVGEHKTCDLSSSTNFVWNIFHYKTF